MLSEEKLIKEANNAIEWIAEYVKNTGAKGVVVGVSGGKDSATVMAMAVKALGKENVFGVIMPCNSVSSDYDDALLAINSFGIRHITVNLKNTFYSIEESINEEFEENISKEAEINIKPRLRMTTLYAVAQSLGYLVIGTGNLSEGMMGYTTKWGDNAFDFNPIANFTVSEVLAIGKYLGVPSRILEKAPNDGLGGKTDEEKMGVSYNEIEEMIETGETVPEAKEKIMKLYNTSKHKREKLPVYTFERTNFFDTLEK